MSNTVGSNASQSDEEQSTRQQTDSNKPDDNLDNAQYGAQSVVSNGSEDFISENHNSGSGCKKPLMSENDSQSGADNLKESPKDSPDDEIRRKGSLQQSLEGTNDCVSSTNTSKEDSSSEADSDTEVEEHFKCFQELKKNYLIVAAIDFGTTQSGLAFSTVNDFLSDPNKISAYTWTSDYGLFKKNKTCILFSKEGAQEQRFFSCGYKAEKKYLELCESDEHQDWFFFTNYKMELHDNMDISKDYLLETVDGKEMPALVVFSETIRYYVCHFQSNIIYTFPDLRQEDVRWVLTVPAIWTEKAKQFMRIAAVKAGIPPDQLMISLEPEAAALYLKTLPPYKDTRFTEVFLPDTAYLVLDIGGGTYDITVNKMTTNGLEELHIANGGNFGGESLNHDILSLFRQIYGEDMIEHFRRQYVDEAYDLDNEIELKKKQIKHGACSSYVTFKVPPLLHELFTEEKKIEELHEQVSSYKGIEILFKKAKLKVQVPIFQRLFIKCVIKIYWSVFKILSNPDLSDLKYILMVGGFSESHFLFHRLITLLQLDFPHIQVLRPEGAVDAVLKGAVVYGHDPSAYKTRVIRFTYGVESHLPFDEMYDKRSLLVEHEDGESFCKQRFCKHVSVGQTVEVGTYTQGIVYFPFQRNQKKVRFPFYISSHPDPRYVHDSSCRYLGQLVLDLSDLPLEEQTLEVSMKFGETELATVCAKEVKTGREVYAELQFLR